MAGDKVPSFKISRDQQRPAAPVRKKGEAEPADDRAQDKGRSLGFARIENILESVEPQALFASLNDTLGRLNELAEKSTANKDKAAAKKAIVAVERTIDLMEYLFQTKDQLAASQTE